MRAGILVTGIIILILSASFFYIQKPIATPANPDGWNDALEAATEQYWSLGGMVLGAMIILAALLLPRKPVNLKKSPLKEYPKTSAGQDDGTRIDLF